MLVGHKLHCLEKMRQITSLEEAIGVSMSENNCINNMLND